MTSSGRLSRRHALAAFASACALYAYRSPAHADENHKLPIRIAWLPGTCGRLYAAQAFNLFEKAGLDATLIRFDSGPAMNAAYQSSSVDIGYMGIPGFLVALGATPIKAFLLENQADKAEGLVVRGASGIGSMKDLAGKKIGVPVGTTAWMGLIQGLTQASIKPSAVQIIDMKVGVVVPAFQRGDVDGIYVWAPWLFDLQSEGGKLIATDSDWMVNGNIWAGRTKWLEDNRETTRRFLAAMHEATTMITTHRADVAKNAANRMGIPVEVADELLRTVLFPSFEEQLNPSYRLSLNNPHGGLRAVITNYKNVFSKYGLLKMTPENDGAVDPSFMLAYQKTK